MNHLAKFSTNFWNDKLSEPYHVRFTETLEKHAKFLTDSLSKQTHAPHRTADSF